MTLIDTREKNGQEWAKIITDLIGPIFERLGSNGHENEAHQFRATAGLLQTICLTEFDTSKVDLPRIANRLVQIGCDGMNPLQATELILAEIPEEN